MSEIWALKESWPTDLSPMAIFSLADAARGGLAVMSTAGMVEGRCTRGGAGRVYRVGTRRGYTGTPPGMPQDPYLT